MVALARWPGPKTFCPLFNPISLMIGPLTIIKMAVPAVVAVTPCSPKSGWVMARTVAATTGKYSGRHPAMTALMAAFSAVKTRFRSGMDPRISVDGSWAASRKALTFSSVGGMIGRPSVHPRS